jgi:SecD/SecF fusion protein
MRRYLHRIIICLVPVLISLVVVARAYYQYEHGQGGFRLGVDLAGGTILVYEVDETKLASEKFKPDELAASLKKRIDPNDLLSITIRPIGGSPPRVEIILPTGGLKQAKAEMDNWVNLLQEVSRHYDLDPATLLDQLIKGPDKKTGNEARAEQPDQTRIVQLANLIKKAHPDETPGDIDAFVRENKGDWKALLAAVVEKYQLRPDQILKGAVDLNQYVVLGDIIKKYKGLDSEKDREEVNTFIDRNSGASKDKKLLTSTEVEHIKEKIEQQGRLEFNILANELDDKPAIDAANKWLTDPANQAELERLNEVSEAPPPPINTDGTRYFPSEVGGRYSYRWLEVGKAELYSLRMNSEALARPEEAPFQRVVEQARKDHHIFHRMYLDPTRGWATDTTGPVLYTREIKDWSRRLAKDRQQKKTVEYYVLVRDTTPEDMALAGRNVDVTGDFLAGTGQGNDDKGRPCINFSFDSEGANRFYELTSKNAPKDKSGFKRYLAIVFDGKVDSAPTLNSTIRSHGQISGEFTQQEIIDRLDILRAGALPATLRKDPVSQNSMGATLGDLTIKKGTWAVFWAFLAVLVFMMFYYRFAGFVACVALLANLLMTVAFMVLVKAAFTLPGLAGLVLMLGMAVDANVLIYERLREERERGATLALAIRNGYDRAFPTIIDTHLSSIFTAIVLYMVGNDQLKGFGISLTAGLIISLFTSLYMTRTMFEVWLAQNWLHKLKFAHVRFRLGGWHFDLHDPKIDFMAIRYYWFAGTTILTILGATLFFYRLNHGALNIDFVGGTAYTAELRESDRMTLEQLRDKLVTDKPKDFEDVSVEQVFLSSDNALDGKSSMFTVRVSAGHVTGGETQASNLERVFQFVHERLPTELKKVVVKDWKFEDAHKTKALLEFADQDGNVGYASPAQIQLLLRQEIDQQRINAQNPFQVDKDPSSNMKDQRFDKLVVTKNPTAKINAGQFEKLIQGVKAKMDKTAQPERLENFDAQLAASTRLKALYAILASWAAILLYLWFRFGSWTFGAATVLCLIHDLFFTLGAIVACHYVVVWTPGLASFLQLQDFKFDLQSVAALLTLVGYSVNDTIVVFDRIREVRGKNPALTPKMINDSVNQTLSRTLLASMTVWVVVIVLYLFGGDGVKLFAFVMVVGVIVGTYSSIYIASPLLLIFGEGRVPAEGRGRVPAPTPGEEVPDSSSEERIKGSRPRPGSDYRQG